jgi:hypothetical protein
MSEAVAKSATPSMSDFLPKNVDQTLKNAQDAHQAAKQDATDKINENQSAAKKAAYLQRYSGDPNAKQPYTYVDIIDVFASFVSYKTPDISTSLKPQTPAGTAMDLSHVILGLQPAFVQNMSDVPAIVTFLDKHDLNYKTIKDLSGAQLLVASAKLKMSEPSLATEVAQVKPLLEKYRQPMLDAMFCFDDPSMCAQAAPAPAPAPAPAAPAAPAEKSRDGFATMSASDSTYFAVGMILSALGLFALWFFSAKQAIPWVRAIFGNRYVKWSRQIRQQTRRTRR